MTVVSSNMITQVKDKKLNTGIEFYCLLKTFDVSRICADLVK